MLKTAEQEIEQLLKLHPKGFDLSLKRITRLLNELGNPHLKLPPVIHIAGTNGKGSAAAFARAILECAGFSVHVHTSPHLVNWHERYRIGRKEGGLLVSDEVLAQAVCRVARANARQAITIFEILTAVAFVLFSEHPADAVILEVGLGGRYDATNVILKPAVSLIMPVSLDHQSYLGDRVEEIAAEKAGIIKRNCPVVIGYQENDSAHMLMVKTAEQLNCRLSIYGQDYFTYEEHGRMIYQNEMELIDLPLPRLLGRYQLSNAAAAIKAVHAAGFDISHHAIEKAMRVVEWPARMQYLSHGKLVDWAVLGAEIWLDGGHNPSAATVIAKTFAEWQEHSPRSLVLIAGMINTKNTSDYFKAFANIAQHVFTVPIHSSDAGIPPDVLATAAQTAGLSAEPAHSVKHALKRLRDRWDAKEIPPYILITGSLYLAGDVLAENGTPPI